jgi:hypothetical protein
MICANGRLRSRHGGAQGDGFGIIGHRLYHWREVLKLLKNPNLSSSDVACWSNRHAVYGVEIEPFAPIIIVGMCPSVRRDLAPFGQLDHVERRRQRLACSGRWRPSVSNTESIPNIDGEDRGG